MSKLFSKTFIYKALLKYCTLIEQSFSMRVYINCMCANKNHPDKYFVAFTILWVGKHSNVRASHWCYSLFIKHFSMFSNTGYTPITDHTIVQLNTTLQTSLPIYAFSNYSINDPKALIKTINLHNQNLHPKVENTSLSVLNKS